MTYKQGDNELSLWNEEDGLYYDAIEFDHYHSMQLPVRSLVGLIPLYATMVLEPHVPGTTFDLVKYHGDLSVVLSIERCVYLVQNVVHDAGGLILIR